MLEPGLGVNQRAYHLVQPLTAVSTTAAEIWGHQEAVTRKFLAPLDLYLNQQSVVDQSFHAWDLSGDLSGCQNNNAGGDMLALSHEKTEGDLQLLTA